MTDKRNHLVYIIETVDVKTTAVGVVRFERKASDWCVVSINIAEKFTGRGIGVRALQRGFTLCRNEWPGCAIHAFVRESNQISYSTFKKAGYRRTKEPIKCPHPDHIEMVIM